MTALVEAINLIHQPRDEEAEFWFGDPGHLEQFPKCVSESECEGHTVTVQVCTECGYEHDDGYPVFRRWPCPTSRAANEKSAT